MAPEHRRLSRYGTLTLSEITDLPRSSDLLARNEKLDPSADLVRFAFRGHLIDPPR
jgi:hypothetical protein